MFKIGDYVTGRNVVFHLKNNEHVQIANMNVTEFRKSTQEEIEEYHRDLEREG